MNSRRKPGVAVVAAALRVTTERLVLEIASPQAEPPHWNDLEWRVAQAVCAMHGISAFLATRLVWRGPPFFTEFLQGQRLQMLACHARIGQTLDALHRAAVHAGLHYVALKGSALREFALHHPGERPMGDIDILIRPADRALTVRVLDSIDYESAYASRRHDVFVPRGGGTPHAFAEDLRNPLRIEVHQRVCEALPVEMVDITSQIWPGDTRAGVNGYRSFAALVRHVMLHTCGNMRANAMRFLQIYEVALLARRLGMVDWQELMGENPPASAWWMYPALTLAERYVPGSVPPRRLRDFAACCPPRLRKRFDRCSIYDVSWSNLRIPALPGMEWSRGWLEALQFARSRAFPSRQAREDLAAGIAAWPRLRQTRWYGVSHAERILRWLFLRPPRVQTLLAVTAALQSERHAD